MFMSEDSCVDASLHDPYLPSEDTPLRDTNSCSTSFTAEEVAKFKKRYERFLRNSTLVIILQVSL